MDDEILIGYQLERYHHIQNQAAKILGLVLTAFSTVIALIGAVILEVIELPDSVLILFSNIVGDGFLNFALLLNSLLTFLISAIIFVITLIMYWRIVSDSNIITDIQPIGDFDPQKNTDRATIVNNKVTIDMLESLWKKSSAHMTGAIVALLLGIFSMGYSSIPDQSSTTIVHLIFIFIPITGAIVIYFTENSKRYLYNNVLLRDNVPFYIIIAITYILIWIVSFSSILSLTNFS
jgi:hypothetical protein